MCYKNGSKVFFVLLLNSQKMAPISLEVFKQPPAASMIIEWARKLKIKELSELQVIPIEIPYNRLI
jgi:hypothetical protein